MSFLGILLLLLFIYFIVLPGLKLWQAVRRARSRTREFFGQGAPRQNQRQSARPQPRRRHKKIDPDVGEYVDFEDIPTYTSPTEASTSETTIHYREEEQITDVEWEDVK